MTERIIDTPSPFAPLDEWREYLAELKTIKPRDDEIARLIEEAEKEVNGTGARRSDV